MTDRSGARRRRLSALTVAVALVASGWTTNTAAAPTSTETATETTSPPTEPEPTNPDEIETLSPEELARRQAQIRIEHAQRHYERATAFYSGKRYAEAAAEFESSYAAVPAAATLYNVALSHERASKAVEAIHALRRYLELPDCTTLPRPTIGCTSRRADAVETLGEQMRLVGELSLGLAEGVELREVRVAGRTVPQDDFPVLLLPGAVDVELFGMAPRQRRSRVAYITAGEPFTLYVAPFETEVVLRPELPDDVVSPDVLRRERQQRLLRTSFWAGVGLTTAAGIGLAVVGGLTLYEQRRFNAERCEAECSSRDENGEFVLDDQGNRIPLDNGYPLDHRENFRRYQPIQRAMIGVTVGLAVGTALIGGFAFQKRDREHARVRLQGPGLALRW